MPGGYEPPARGDAGAISRLLGRVLFDLFDFELLDALGQGDKLLAQVAGVVLGCVLGGLEDLLVVGGAAVGRAAEEHAHRGDGGCEAR